MPKYDEIPESLISKLLRYTGGEITGSKKGGTGKKLKWQYE